MVLYQLWAQTSKLHPLTRRWDGGFKFFSQWRCSETTWCSSCEGKATVCLPVCLKIIDIVCILAQKIINLQYIQNPNIKISCCDFVEKRCFQVLCFYQLSISEQQSKKLKKIEKLMQEIIIFSKVFHGFLFWKILTFFALCGSRLRNRTNSSELLPAFF